MKYMYLICALKRMCVILAPPFGATWVVTRGSYAVQIHVFHAGINIMIYIDLKRVELERTY